MASFAVLLLLFGHCQSYRITDSSVVEASSEEQACDVNTCVTFQDATSECSCKAFVTDPVLLERSEKTLYGIVQASRYLTDQQAESPGFIRSLYPVRVFRQMKHASLLSSTMKEFEFLQSAMDVLEGVDDLADESVSNLTGDFKAPAGAFPIMVAHGSLIIGIVAGLNCTPRTEPKPETTIHSSVRQRAALIMGCCGGVSMGV